MGVQGHLQLRTEFKPNLRCMRPCLVVFHAHLPHLPWLPSAFINTFSMMPLLLSPAHSFLCVYLFSFLPSLSSLSFFYDPFCSSLPPPSCPPLSSCSIPSHHPLLSLHFPPPFSSTPSLLFFLHSFSLLHPPLPPSLCLVL